MILDDDGTEEMRSKEMRSKEMRSKEMRSKEMRDVETSYYGVSVIVKSHSHSEKPKP
jgi:hypothetical protein